MKPDVIQFGLVRSGSTLIHRLVRRIVKDEFTVAKAHTFDEGMMPGVPVVATIRDPRDVLVSYWNYIKTHNCDIIEPKELASVLLDVDHSCEQLENVKVNCSVLCLRYEDFFRGTDALENAAKQIVVYLPEHLIKPGCCLRCAVYDAIYSDYPPNHKSPDPNPGKWRKILPEKYHTFVTDYLMSRLASNNYTA